MSAYKFELKKKLITLIIKIKVIFFLITEFPIIHEYENFTLYMISREKHKLLDSFSFPITYWLFYNENYTYVHVTC